MEQRQWNGLTSIHFYIREGYFGSALSECEKRLVESKEPRVAVLRGFIMILLERRSEGMRILEGLKDGLYALGALHGLRLAYTRSPKPDKDSLREIEGEIGRIQKEARVESIVSAAEILLLSGQSSKAKPLIDKAIEDTKATDPIVLTLAGWIELSLGRDQKTAQKYFEKGAGMGYADAYLGRVALLESRHSIAQMRIVAKELSTSNVRLIPAHIINVKSLICDREWDIGGQTIANALLVQEDSVYLLFLQTIHSIVYKGRDIERSISELSIHFDSLEKGNDSLAFSFASFFTRISLKNTFISQIARKMLERAIKINANKAEYSVLAFRLFVSIGDQKEANIRAKEILQTDSNDPIAILSMVICNLIGGRIKDALSQLAFVKEAHSNMTNKPLFHFLDAVCTKYSSGSNSFDRFIFSCRSAVQEQIALLQEIPYGIDAIYTLDVDFLVGIVYQLLDFAPITPTKGNDETLKEMERILSFINDYCPGLTEVNYLLSKVKWLQGEMDTAERLIDTILDSNEATAEAFLLKAQIKIDKGRIDEAEMSLDTGLSFSFSVRDSPLFHLIKAKVQKRRNEHERAIEALKEAIAAPERESGVNLLARKEKDSGHRISLYLELIDSLQSLKRTKEADTVMNNALNKWKGTQEEEQLILMNAQLHVSKGDADGALAILSTVKPNQTNYQAARTKMAEIYLEEKKDKQKFTVMFKELLEKDGSPSTYALLGDAYMSVQNPKLAMESYEKALKANPKDHTLAEKIGESYIQCHQYTKAVNYYEAALKSGRDSNMRIKLANLLFRMGNYDKCERILTDPLNKDLTPTDINVIQSHVQYYILLSKVHHEKGIFDKANEDLVKAKNLQQRIIGRTEGAMNIQMRKECAKICCQIAEMHQLKRDMQKAIEAYKEALTLNETDIKTNLSLAQAYLSTGRMDQCNKQCQAVTNIDKNNIEATLMMADILYNRSHMEQAINRFEKVLDQSPNNYHALARYIELSWREGTVTNADNGLRRAIEYNPRATVDAGYNYCKGIHEWYSGELNLALQAFNRARRDLEWGEKAIYNIVEICLNPENEIIGDNMDNDDPYERANTKTAERFLNELHIRNNSQDSKYNLHMTMIKMASGEKLKIQEALDTFLAIALEHNTEKVKNVGAVLRAARAYMALKQSPKAKQLLKKVMGIQWNLEDSDNLEKCWLLLAELYTNQGKSEQAKELIQNVLKINKSSIKAFELMGFIFEKDQKWHDAVAYYTQAWKYCRNRNPVIGYKLAYNNLKAKRHFDCIVVCQKVLDQYPQYPKIRKELMEKAKMNIRT